MKKNSSKTYRDVVRSCRPEFSSKGICKGFHDWSFHSGIRWRSCASTIIGSSCKVSASFFVPYYELLKLWRQTQHSQIILALNPFVFVKRNWELHGSYPLSATTRMWYVVLVYGVYQTVEKSCLIVNCNNYDLSLNFFSEINASASNSAKKSRTLEKKS